MGIKSGPWEDKLLRISEDFELSEFELSEVKWLKKVGQNQGKWTLLRIIQLYFVTESWIIIIIVNHLLWTLPLAILNNQYLPRVFNNFIRKDIRKTIWILRKERIRIAAPYRIFMMLLLPSQSRVSCCLTISLKIYFAVTVN